MTDWLPALTPTVLLGGGLWLGRHLILTRLTASVRHEFEGKIEGLRSEVRQREELLKAGLRAQEAALEALRQNALTAMTSRQMAVDKRRIEAVDELWSAVTALRVAKPAVMFMSFTKFETAAERTAVDPKLRQLFQELGGQVDITKLDQVAAARARPFISTPAWATYTAILSVLGFAMLRLQVLRSGGDLKSLKDSTLINKLLSTALPHQASVIEKYGVMSHPWLLDELENKLLRELQQMLSGTEADKEALGKAAEIVKQAHELQKEMTKERVEVAT